MKLSLKKKISYILYNMIAKQLPRTYMPYSLGSKYIRYFLVKSFIDKCGENVKIQSGVLLSPSIELGDNCEINENVRIRSNIKIGNDVLLAPSVSLLSVNHTFTNIEIPIREQGENGGFIVIGDDVWIGTNAIVLPNIIIGNHVIVGAGTIVAKNIPDYAIVVGNPAKIIRYRKEGTNEK